VESSEAAVGERLEAVSLCDTNLRELAREAARLLHTRYNISDPAPVSVTLCFMAPDLGLTGQGSLLLRVGLGVIGMVRSLWTFRDFLVTEVPCSEEELAAMVASAPKLCIEAKIALMAWVLIVGSWVSERSVPGLEVTKRGRGRGGASRLGAKEKEKKMLQLMAVATHVMRENVGAPDQKKKLNKIFKDLKKVLKV
jgi:hypothetical protein